jgi:hypothetical protein
MIVCGQDWLFQDGEIRLYSTVKGKPLSDGLHFFRAVLFHVVPDSRFRRYFHDCELPAVGRLFCHATFNLKQKSHAH